MNSIQPQQSPHCCPSSISCFPIPPPHHTSLLDIIHSHLSPNHHYTKCPGSKKFATPSITLYSCPHSPHTNLPSFTHVSSSTLCRSFAVCVGTSSTPSSPSVALPFSPPSTRSSRVGGVGGRSGRPSYVIFSKVLRCSNRWWMAAWGVVQRWVGEGIFRSVPQKLLCVILPTLTAGVCS